MIKKILKYTLILTVSMFIAGLLFILTLSGLVVGWLAPTDNNVVLQENAVLEIPVNGLLAERGTENPLSLLLGEEEPTLSLEEARAAIREACDNPSVRAIYLKGGLLYAEPGAATELRNALQDFKERSGKPIIAYADTYSQSSYYVCSAADKLLLNPEGQIDWHGLAAEPMFYKDLLAKVGIRMEVFKVGTYKSAVEPFTMNAMSDANKEQVTAYLQDIWGEMVKAVAATRHLREDSLQHYADRYTLLMDSHEIIALKMADSLTYADEARAQLRKTLALEEDDKLQIVSTAELAAVAASDAPTTGEAIAVYYASGDIVSTPLTGMTGKEIICSDEVVKDLEALGKDENVKAVVLRISSGGGSAYASEQIWRSVRLLQEKKPVVVSMGGMAASGAYYLASGANFLMATPTTLTGSIGIFGMFPDASELLTDKLGLHFDGVKTNRHADFGTLSRPMNGEEKALMQGYINRGYDLFLKRVADGRKMKKEDVEKLAAGRVWTGLQALKNGLVDSIGTLEDAVAKAAELCRAEDYRIEHHPQQTPWYESLLDEGREHYLEGHLKQALGELYEPLRFLSSAEHRDRIQARIPYLPNIQ